MIDFFRKTAKLFWNVQIIFWCTYLIINMIFGFLYCPKSQQHFHLNLEFKFISTLTGIFYSLIVQYLCYLLRKIKVSILLIIIFILPIAYIFSLLWAWNIDYYYSFIFDFSFNPAIQNYVLHGFDLFFIITSLCIFYFLINYWQELQIQRENTLRAEALAHQSQLQMLHYQLNPHFLFNALNSIRSLTIENADKAWHMITDLSEFLRYSLINRNIPEVRLEEEINAIEKYLEIQNFRYEEKLVTEFHIDSKALEIKIPCFLIHPLVENAIKYGMQTSSLPLKININVKLENNVLNIVVCNSGKLIDNGNKKESSGIGLENIRQRLNLIYPGKSLFKIFEENNYVNSSIEIIID